MLVRFELKDIEVTSEAVTVEITIICGDRKKGSDSVRNWKETGRYTWRETWTESEMWEKLETWETPYFRSIARKYAAKALNTNHPEKLYFRGIDGSGADPYYLSATMHNAAAKTTENETTTTEDNKTSMETKQEEKTMTNTNYYDLIKAAAENGNDYAKKAIEFINEATMDPVTITEHAYQLTAYERYCGVDRDDIKKYVAAEFMDDPSVYAINDYLEDSKYYDDIAYSMDDFNEICGNMEPWEIARSCVYGDFKPYDEMFYFNGYGNLTSCSEWEYVNQWRDDVNEWILSEEKTDYMSDEAQEIMESDNSMAIMISCDALISLGF